MPRLKKVASRRRDLPYPLGYVVDQTAKLDVQQASSFKQTVEATLGSDNVVIDIIQLSPDEKDNATFFADTADQKDYDIDISGWSGDFSDPKTILTFWIQTQVLS